MNIFKKSPAIYPAGTLKKCPLFWSQLTQQAHWGRIQNVSIVLISFWSVGTLRTFSKNTQGFLSQIYSKCVQIIPEPLIESSSKECSQICSQCAHRVYSNVFKENLQWGPILTKTLNELIGYAVEHIVDIFGSILWKNSQWVAQV